MLMPFQQLMFANGNFCVYFHFFFLQWLAQLFLEHIQRSSGDLDSCPEPLASPATVDFCWPVTVTHI